MAHDAAVGGVMGGAMGFGVAGVLAIATPVLFVAAPVLGPPMAAGYGAAIGGTVGPAAGLRMKNSEFTKIVEDALRRGHAAVLTRIDSDRKQEIAERVFRETTAERQVEQ